MAAWSKILQTEPHSRRVAKKPRRKHRSIVAALAALAPSLVSGEIVPTGFQNSYYQGLDYNGSRVLEQLEPSRYTEYLKVKWTQSVTLDVVGRVWLVDRNEHVVVQMPPSTRYIPWAALYYDYAGTRGMPGSMNGSRKQVKFDSPTGISVFSVSEIYNIIYVSDTNNHCIRKIDTKDERVSNIVGLPRMPGLRDGPSKEARLRFPQSIGLDTAGVNLMVLDNGRRVRHVKVRLINPTITTLTDGACRSISRWTYLTSIEFREVGCHTDWKASDVNDADVSTHVAATVCLGHKATCGTRNHPALQDIRSPMLRLPVTTTTSSTTTLR